MPQPLPMPVFIPAEGLAVVAQAAGGPGARPGGLELLLTYLPMLLIVLVAWLLLYRPERERQRRHQDLLAALKKNERVVTTSGIYGIVANVDRENDRVLLKIDDAANVKIAVTLASIAKVLGSDDESPTANG
ncbi:MAG: preprotein translocase subunit YajC [Planctomycetia bacterium]